MLYQSAYLSLLIQSVTGLTDFWGLTIKVPEDKKIFKDLLKVELGVQTIEFIFYAWMVRNFDKIENITPYRYFDWLITTPTMLVTLMAYLDTKPHKGLKEYISENKGFIIQVVILNLIMLVAGLLGELKYTNYTTSILVGFVPFVYYFKLIYDKYIKDVDTTRDRKGLFWFFLVVWSLYGVAALFPYDQKNTIYNILDLFAKNLFGLFLVYVLWKNRIK